MSIHIIYTNNYKNFLFEENSFDKLTKNNYIIDKLKELLFKSIPGLVNASKKIINLCVGLIEFLYDKLIQKNDKLNEGWTDSITGVFNSLYDVINNIFTNEQSEMIVLDKTVLDQNSIEINEFLKENIIEKETILIDINDIESINKICKFEEIKLFAIKTEENYICMPLDDKDFKGFKAIAMTEYYRSYYNVSGDIFEKINNLTLNFLEFLKNNPDFKENKQYKINNLTVEFEYHKDLKKINYGGYFSQEWYGKENKIIIVFSNFKDFKKNLNWYISALQHEYIHYIDYERNKDKFTNWDLKKFTNKIFEEYGNSKEIDLKDLQAKLGIRDDSAFRYLIGLMQKHKYIDYVKTSDGKSNYTKINVLIETELGGGNVVADNTIKLKNINYFNDPVELNTHLNDLINQMINDENLTDKIDETVQQLLKPGFYISKKTNSNNFIPLPRSFWEKIDKVIKNTPDIIKIAKSDISLLNKTKTPESIKEMMDLLKKLKTFKKINLINFFEYELTNFFKKISGNEYRPEFSIPVMYVKFFIKNVFIDKKYERYELESQVVKDFKNNNFEKIIEIFKNENELKFKINILASEYAELHSNIYKNKLLGKNYTIDRFAIANKQIPSEELEKIKKIDNYTIYNKMY